jgi:hypothetical protein
VCRAAHYSRMLKQEKAQVMADHETNVVAERKKF